MPEVQEYKVNLDNYYGPLDLLLHLVKETEVDITAITLARACEQYISFLTAMERLDIDLSGNFLALASQLLLIKSRTLAPPEVAVEGEGGEEEQDEAAASLELIKKLLDYKRFKDRARALDHLAAERARRLGRPRLRLEGETEQEPLRNLELWDLVLLFSKVIKGTRLDAMLSILYRDVPLEIFIERILKSLAQKRMVRFSELVPDRADRAEVIGAFLALLELAKEQRLNLDQEVDHDDILIEAREESPQPSALSSQPPAAESSTTVDPDPPAEPNSTEVAES